MVLPSEGHLERHAPFPWLGEGEGWIINPSAFWCRLDVRDGRVSTLVEDVSQRPVTLGFQRRQVRDVRGEVCGGVHDQHAVLEKNLHTVTPHGDLGRLFVCLLLSGGRL